MDNFFSKQNCDRCYHPFKGCRTQSWFIEKECVICSSCEKKEDIIKKELRKRGITDAMEGCGYVPTI